MPESLFAKVRRHYGQHGWRETVAVVVKNLCCLLGQYREQRFDRRHNVQTVGNVDLADLLIASANKDHGVHYEPTPPKVFRHVLAKLDVDCRKFEFIDFGCGKGRVLLMAARYPFLRITGIEFAPALAEIARRNIAAFHDDCRQCRQIDVLCRDAAEFEIPDTPAILYLFNPFDVTVVEAIGKNLARSHARSRTTKYVIYYNPQNESVFGKLGFLQKVASEKRVFDFASLSFHGYSVYRTID